MLILPSESRIGTMDSLSLTLLYLELRQQVTSYATSTISVSMPARRTRLLRRTSPLRRLGPP